MPFFHIFFTGTGQFDDSDMSELWRVYLNVRAKCSEGNLNRKHILLVTICHNFPVIFAKNIILDLLIVLFAGGVPDFTK